MKKSLIPRDKVFTACLCHIYGQLCINGLISNNIFLGLACISAKNMKQKQSYNKSVLHNFFDMFQDHSS